MSEPKLKKHLSFSGKDLMLLAVLVIFGIAVFVLLRPENPKELSTSKVLPSKINDKALTPQQCTAELPTSFLSGQVLMVDIQASDLSAKAPVFKKYSIGGAVMMSSPTNPHLGSINKFKKAGSSLGVPLLMSTDEEGGDIQRFVVLGKLPSPQEMAETFNLDQAQNAVNQQGTALKAVGIDMVLGPLADVGPIEGTSILGSRVFSNDPTVVSRYVTAYVHGWQAARILPTLKHFPGMGSASGNTDYQIATTPTLNELKKRDFIPYQNALAKNSLAVMVGNQNVPGWFSGPASFSPTVNEYLRNNLGYKNTLIVTDSLRAQAITDRVSLPSAVVKSIAAGNDMALIVKLPNDPIPSEDYLSQIKKAIIAAVKNGTISKQQLADSVTRKLQVQHVDSCALLPLLDY